MNACGRCEGAFRAIEVQEAVRVASFLFNGPVPAQECVSCREVYVPAASAQRFRLRAALMLRDCLKNPEVLQFVRKALGLYREDLAELCAVPADLVVQWEESRREIPPEVSVILNALVRDKLEGRVTAMQTLQAARRKPKK